MATTDNVLSDLIINDMTQEEYDNLVATGQVQEGQIYATDGAGSGGGASLPDQTDNAGKFLITDGTMTSWGASYAKSVDNNKQVNIGDIDAAFDDAARASAYVAIGAKSCGGWTVCVLGESPYSYNICIGSNSNTNFTSKAVVIGYSAKSDGGLFDVGQVAIGAYAKTGAKCAIQLGGGSSSKGYTNSDANTFKVGNVNGNFEMMSADGTIPADRMSATAGTTGQVLTKTDTGMAWADASGGDGDIDCGVMS